MDALVLLALALVGVDVVLVAVWGDQSNLEKIKV